VSQLKRKADASEVQQLMKTVADLQLQLQRKADCIEVVALQADLKRQLDTKADASDVKAVQIQAAQVTMQPQSTALKSPPRAKRASGGVVSSKSSSPEPSLSPPRSAVVMQPVTACVQARWVGVFMVSHFNTGLFNVQHLTDLEKSRVAGRKRCPVGS
jgi:hypothetical protein